MTGLSLFKRTNCKRTWNIASFHSPHSLTWSWILGFSKFGSDEARVWPLFYSYRDNNGLQWGLRVPFVGFIRWSRQREMWYRDLYRDLRDEHDGVGRYSPNAAKHNATADGMMPVALH